MILRIVIIVLLCLWIVRSVYKIYKRHTSITYNELSNYWNGLSKEERLDICQKAIDKAKIEIEKREKQKRDSNETSQ